MENRFLEFETELLNTPAKSARARLTGAMSVVRAPAGGPSWERSLSAAQRVLVILIDNGGIDLGIPELVDRILAAMPGPSVIPSELKQKLVEFIRKKLREITDNLLESAELALNRYTAAKPDLYSDVVVLRDATASLADLKSQLIANSRAGRVIDVLVLTHGSKDTIWVGSRITGDNLRQIRKDYGKPLSIRSVYMMNCEGSTLNQAWLDCGACVSSGSKGTNYLPEPTTFFFWQKWKAGKEFGTAATGAFADTVELMNGVLREAVSKLTIPGLGQWLPIDLGKLDFVQQSAPVVLGRTDLKITDDELSCFKSVSGGMMTTVVPARAFDGADAGGSNAMAPSEACIDFVKGCEGFSASLYNDPVGHCTIGYGTLVHRGNCDGSDSEQPYQGGVSKDEARRLLAQDLAGRAQALNRCLKVSVNQCQFDALLSFAYNVGTKALEGSTLLRLLNQGKYDAVPTELKKWTKARNSDGTLVDVPGLVRRREAEAALFVKPPSSSSQSIGGFPLGQLGRMLAQTGSEIPVRHSYRFHSPSLATSASRMAVQMNPAALVAGIEIADAIQIGLAGVAVVQAQVSASQGSFTLSYDKAQRLLTPEARAAMPGSQTGKKSYSLELFSIGASRLLGDPAHAKVIIEWEGNPYGEISTPVIRRDLANSTEWSKSSNNTTITKVDRIPLPRTDPRTWPIVYTYEGTYDPVGNGYFEYSGEFEINAFGGLKFNRHEVFSRSLVDWAIAGKPEEYVRKGRDVIATVPDIPAEQLAYLRTKLP